MAKALRPEFVRRQVTPDPDTSRFARLQLGHSRRFHVVDLGGRALRTLPLAAEQRILVWDGTDDAGRSVPAGIYWVVMPDRSRARVVRLR